MTEFQLKVRMGALNLYCGLYNTRFNYDRSTLCHFQNNDINSWKSVRVIIFLKRAIFSVQVFCIHTVILNLECLTIYKHLAYQVKLSRQV